MISIDINDCAGFGTIFEMIRMYIMVTIRTQTYLTYNNMN